MKKSENITVSATEIRRLIMKEYGDVSADDRIQHKSMRIVDDGESREFYDTHSIIVTFERNK